MSPMMKSLGIDRLSAAERMELALDIWESLDDRPGGQLTDEQRAELRRRKADMEANPGIALTWAEVRASIEGKK